MASEMVTLPADAIPDLRRMLVIGLAALGELERVEENLSVINSVDAQVKQLITPLHPTGAHEVGNFAEALMWLDHARDAAA